MQKTRSSTMRPVRLPRLVLVTLVVGVSAMGGVMTKRLTTAPVPVLAVVDHAHRPAASPAIDVVAATPESATARATPGVIIEVEEIDDPLRGRTTEPTRWVDEDGVRWERAPAGYERYYNGRPLVRVKTLWMVTTAYSPDHRSCGKWADGKTASMKSVWTNGMELVAADRRVLDFGSLVSIPGYADERVVPVLDVGGAIKGARLDLLYPTHKVALKWGVQRLPVTVWGYADEVEG